MDRRLTYTLGPNDEILAIETGGQRFIPESKLNTALGLLASIRNDAADLMRDGQPDARLNRILSCATHMEPPK